MDLCARQRCPFPVSGAGELYGLCERHGREERNRRLAERDAEARAREEAALMRPAPISRVVTALPPAPPSFHVSEPQRLSPPPVHHKASPARPARANPTLTSDPAPEAEESPMPNDIARPAHIGFACEAHPVTTLSETLQATMLALAHYFKGPGVDHEGNWKNTLAEDLNISPHAAYQRLTRLEAELCITDTGTEAGIKRLEQIHITAVGWATVEHLRDEQEEASALASVAQTEDATDDDTIEEVPLELERTPFGEEGADTVPRADLAHLAIDLGLLPGASVQEIRDAVAGMMQEQNVAQGRVQTLEYLLAAMTRNLGLPSGAMTRNLGLPSGAQPDEVGNAVGDLAKAHRAVTAERDSLKAALDGAMERSITAQQALRVTEARLREALDEVDRLQEVSRYALTPDAASLLHAASDTLRRHRSWSESIAWTAGILRGVTAALPKPAADAAKAAK